MSKTESITDVKMYCPVCLMITKVGDCEPDIDGDGSLGCPWCLQTMNKKVVMKQYKGNLKFVANIMWEDPECDLIAAVIQIQGYLQYLLNKEVNR